jgi:DNA-binding NtrC family response regulator
MKVLIIDDEIDLSLLLKSYFVRKGYEVILSHTLSDGLVALSEYKPDILFLDNNLPDGTGWDEAPSIVADFPDIKLYLVSAYHPVQPILPEHTVTRTLEKPISFSDLDHIFAASPSNTSKSSEPENIE